MRFWGLVIERVVLCSDCFLDHGLRLHAQRIGFSSPFRCPNCKKRTGKKLDLQSLSALAREFFVNGTRIRTDYGGAPVVEYNQYRTTDVDFVGSLNNDATLISNTLGIGFFYYGPRFWMLGQIEPLLQLQDPDTRGPVIDQILAKYPVVTLTASDTLYRMRTRVEKPSNASEYDGQPLRIAGTGRLDSPGFPMLYASQDIEICIHECRATVDEEIYVGTLIPKRSLRLLDLAEILDDGRHVSEFERLDLAVNMLFLAGPHSYEICRSIAKAACEANFDGIIYPSYFSMVRSGSIPYEATWGLAHRGIVQFRSHEDKKIIRNVAIFGRPVEAGLLEVRCINRVILRQATYDLGFGPVLAATETAED